MARYTVRANICQQYGHSIPGQHSKLDRCAICSGPYCKHALNGYPMDTIRTSARARPTFWLLLLCSQLLHSNKGDHTKKVNPGMLLECALGFSKQYAAIGCSQTYAALADATSRATTHANMVALLCALSPGKAVARSIRLVTLHRCLSIHLETKPRTSRPGQCTSPVSRQCAQVAKGRPRVNGADQVDRGMRPTRMFDKSTLKALIN